LKNRIKKFLGKAAFDLIKPLLEAYLFNPLVHIYILPGGVMPKRQSLLAVGYDVHIRAIMHNTEKDPRNPHFRKVLFDFQNVPKYSEVRAHVVEVEKINGERMELVYRLGVGESVIAGIGFATAMEYRRFFWIAPRSGLATKYGITVTNAPGTVDPDYRGEAGALIYNREGKPYFDLRHGMRIAQIIFCWALTPELREVLDHGDLPPTERGGEGFGSTGIYLEEGKR
jgi:dUTP pyrophosphatase